LRTLLVRTVSVKLRYPTDLGLFVYGHPQMTVGLPGDPRTARVAVERSRHGPALHIAFPHGGVPSLRVPAGDVELAVNLLRRLFDLVDPVTGR
jgi:hypothetical protein